MRTPSLFAMALASRSASGTPRRLDADEGEAVRAAVLLDDLVADANQRPAHVVGGHDLARGH